jgi:formylglycine-generating enzyme required for sulfatase activity
MAEQDHRTNRTRNTIRVAIIILICLLLSYCAYSLYSETGSGSPPSTSANQKKTESASSDRTERPLLSTKQEVLPPSDISNALSGPSEKEEHREEQSPVASDPMKEPPLTTQRTQTGDAEQQRVTSASGKKVIAQTQDGVANDHPGNPPTATPKTVDVAASQLPDEHQESSLDKDIEIFGDTFTEPISGMEFVLVKGGCYQMGSNLTAFEGPVHEVCVDDFYLAKHEVTQTQWTKIIGRHYSYFKGNLRPVERVTWDDAQRFIRQLSSRSGAAYRLPTEAEWEYAARSGGKDKVYSGTSDTESVQRFAWHQVNSNRETHLVGMKKPNSLGLHDMSGNVWEWCSDWYDENYYANSPRNNPQGPDTGTYRVIRGGEWELPASLTRTTYREAAKPHLRRYDIGFRLAFSLPQR